MFFDIRNNFKSKIQRTSLKAYLHLPEHRKIPVPDKSLVNFCTEMMPQSSYPKIRRIYDHPRIRNLKVDNLEKLLLFNRQANKKEPLDSLPFYVVSPTMYTPFPVYHTLSTIKRKIR